MNRPAPTVPDWLWRLNAQECTGCGICADVCTAAAIDMPRNQALPGPVDGACVGCMDCVRECPTSAIAVWMEE